MCWHLFTTFRDYVFASKETKDSLWDDRLSFCLCVACSRVEVGLTWQGYFGWEFWYEWNYTPGIHVSQLQINCHPRELVSAVESQFFCPMGIHCRLCWHCSRHFCYRRKTILFRILDISIFPPKEPLQRSLSVIFGVHRKDLVVKS
jgi:hypothetical protein